MRYHLKEFGSGSEKPRTPKELFNLRHSVKRASRVECAIGLLKGRFRCLRKGLVGKRETVLLMIQACITLHNFIQSRHGKEDNLTAVAKRMAEEEAAEGLERTVDILDSDELQIPEPDSDEADVSPAALKKTATSWRLQLADYAFRQYTSYISRREVGLAVEEFNVARDMATSQPRQQFFSQTNYVSGI